MLMTWVVKVQDVRGLAASEAALEEALAYARRHHIRFVENSVQVAIAGRLLAHAEYDAFDAAVAAYTGGPSWQMQGLEALRWAQAGELPRALLRLPEPDLAAGMPDWIIFTQAVRAQVLWLAGETEAAALAWAAVLEAVPTHPLAVTIDGITTEPFSLLNGAGEALVHLANAAVLAAVDRWLDEKEGEGPAPIFYVAYCESALRQAGLIRLWNGHLDAAETTLRAGLAWCERERCPVEAGRCLLGLAEVAERRGQCEQALADLDRAAALFGQHGAKLYLEQAQTRRTRLRT
jgi:tetratricopeptide (TPR) repeat protein